MGWLFAVALGLQEQQLGAVLRALPPIALGHALSVGIIIAFVLLAGIALSHSTLKFGAAAMLFAFFDPATRTGSACASVFGTSPFGPSLWPRPMARD